PYYAPPPRPLHPFPTRRSSDLPVAGLVHHCPHGHDLARVAAVRAAHAAFEDVVRDLDTHTPTVHGVRCVGHDAAECVRQVGAVRPEMVVRRAAAGAVDGRMNERHEIDVAVAVEVVLRPVHLTIHLAQCLP